MSEVVEGSVDGLPGQVAPAVNGTAPTSDAKPERRPVTSLVAAAAVLAMAVSLFLPWGFIHHTGQPVSDYAAPGPSVASWLLLAVGLAIAAVSLVRRFLVGGTAASGGVGALLFGLGAGLWWASSVLPSVVASGCRSSGGTLCATTPASPTVSQSIGPGLVVALVASLLLFCLTVLEANQSGREGLWKISKWREKRSGTDTVSDPTTS